jgi:plastocyanin
MLECAPLIVCTISYSREMRGSRVRYRAREFCTDMLQGSPLLCSLRTLVPVALLLLSALSSATVPAATLAVTVRLADGKPLPGAVITAHPLETAARPAAPMKASMDQVNLSFSPDVLVIPVGSMVDFPNTDATSHEVYSFSAAHKFQLPLYRGKRYPPEHFDQVGLVTLGCNIHDHMLAYILVTDAPYFGRTGSDGVWAASGVSAGRYRIEVWHPRLHGDPSVLTGEVNVSESAQGQLTVRVTKPLRPTPLEGRLHSWDAY